MTIVFDEAWLRPGALIPNGDTTLRACLEEIAALRAVIAGAAKEYGPIHGPGPCSCGKCQRRWPTPQEAWFCYVAHDEVHGKGRDS